MTNRAVVLVVEAKLLGHAGCGRNIKSSIIK